MFLEMEGRNLCMPCEWGGVDVPCAPIDSIFSGKKVKSCEMGCNHQAVLTKASPCVDVGGSISNGDCFAKGSSALTQCLWTAYTTKAGQAKSICGPCMVVGIGQIPSYAPGNVGPEAGSTVSAAGSMCDMPTTEFGVPCDGGLGIPAVTDCSPTQLPPPTNGPMPLQKIGMGVTVDEGAPAYVAAAILPPYGPKQFTEASAMAARQAGWGVGAALPPDAPINVYGPPPPEGPSLPPTLKLQYAPVLPGFKGVPPPGYGYGTAPPSVALAASFTEVSSAPTNALEKAKDYLSSKAKSFLNSGHRQVRVLRR